jgi:hypothetical protein
MVKHPIELCSAMALPQTKSIPAWQRTRGRRFERRRLRAFFWSLVFFFPRCMSVFSDARKIFLTDENGFLTYHGFMTITTSSRIISRDRLDLTRRRGSCFKFHPVVKQCMLCNLRMFTVNNVVHSAYAIPESTLI